MREQHIFFNHAAIPLEGLYAVSQGTLGAVISHPHPLHGGDMNNSVIEILAETISANGIATLRFNFRGVGRSKGVYNEGNGEKADVLAAVSFLEMQGIRDIFSVGYSFGAWVNAGIITQKDMLPGILISPPFDLFPFSIQTLRGKIGLIICGDRDPFCPAENLKKVASELKCRLELVADSDHFFKGKEMNLATCINRFLR
jgi:alpha/beta superfamily hydrolase